MDRTCNQYVKQALRLARELMILADEGDANENDDGSHILFGVVRDCAYKILRQAERERESHRMEYGQRASQKE